MKKAFVFDFDDTLAFTNARVLVLGPNYLNSDIGDPIRRIVKRLTPAEFNTYELQRGEEFDFSQFKNPEFVLDGKPTKLIELAKQVHGEGHDLFILTARSDSVAGAIQGFLSQFYIKATAVHCVGDSGSDIARNKRKVLLTIMESYNKIYFYDDDAANIEAAEEIGVKSYRVKNNLSVTLDNPKYVSSTNKEQLLKIILDDFKAENPKAGTMTFQQVKAVLESRYGVETRTIGDFFRRQLPSYETVGGNKKKMIILKSYQV